jgi:glycosyltransferase involved in cell wall biosynthesis
MIVCHVTSAHSSDDTRIFHKECVTLAEAGYQVHLVAPGESRDEKDVRVIGVGEKPASRIKRMTQFTKKVYETALDLDCDVYHIHDPELLPYALKLAKRGKKVVYDSHEDYPSTMEVKGYLPAPLRKLVSWLIMKYELKVCRRINAVVCCYHWTAERLSRVCENTELVFNYPIIDSSEPTTESFVNEHEAFVCYAGGISKQWNIDTIIKSLTLCPSVQFRLAGAMSQGTQASLASLEGWEQVDYLGEVPFQQVSQRVYRGALAGMALLDYIPQCRYTVGNLSNTKLFEYMYAGLPLICTDFDLWKDIIKKHECGVCVNPHDEQEVAKAICFLKDHPEERNRMGRRSLQAVLDEYNWGTEERKLLKVYSLL